MWLDVRDGSLWLGLLHLVLTCALGWLALLPFVTVGLAAGLAWAGRRRAALFLLLSLPPLTFMFAHLISMWMGTKTWTWFGFLIIFLVLLLLAVICALMPWA